MWITIEKPKEMQVTAALLKEFSGMARVPGERPFAEWRIAAYQRLLDSGMFRNVTWASAYCEADGLTYRVNGQHTCVLMERQPKLPPFLVVVERYKVSDLEALVQLYNTFDSSLGTRTNKDANHAVASVIPELADVSSKVVNLAVAALSAARWGIHAHRIPVAERAQLLIGEVPFAVWLSGILPGTGTSGAANGGVGGSANARSGPLRRVPVVCAMLATYRLDPVAATKFWTLVRDESHADAKNASRQLGYFLRTVVLAGAHASSTGSHKAISNNDMQDKAVLAWNAWRNNKSTTLRLPRDGSRPEAI